MSACLDILAIGILWVFVLDVSGFVASVEKMVSARLPRPFTFEMPKPFSCSLCMTWWTGVAYLLITGEGIWAYAFLALTACLTPQIHDLFGMIESWAEWIIDKLTI